MATKPSSETNNQSSELPAPEVLAPRSEEAPAPKEESKAPVRDPKAKPNKPLRRTYRPSHRATFIGLAVVAAILAVNAVIITVVIKSQSKNKSTSPTGEVVISQGVLDKLGVNRASIGDQGVQLVVGPDARFNGKVVIGSDVSVAGELKLNSKFVATDASLTQLTAGNTALAKLNVNGDSTVSNLNLRNNLIVTGTSQLQGAVTISSLLTVNNSLNVAGNLSVGGTLAVNNLQVSTLTTGSTLNIGGHVITRGAAPGVSAGSAVGSNGSVSISGNDTAGTVAVNIGVGAGGGTLANISFNTRFSNTPHVVITPIGVGANFYINRSANGFSIGVTSGLPPGGYAFDYIVMQ